MVFKRYSYGIKNNWDDRPKVKFIKHAFGRKILLLSTTI